MDVDDEDERVVVLDLLHGRLSSKRVLDGRELIQARLARGRLRRALRVAEKNAFLSTAIQ